MGFVAFFSSSPRFSHSHSFPIVAFIVLSLGLKSLRRVAIAMADIDYRQFIVCKVRTKLLDGRGVFMGTMKLTDRLGGCATTSESFGTA
ncbi:hypothetical protein F5Y18DRAFT_400323 [Xylariaceae sp. FL1019]|nr:hypothetical protein F5Y18DRAFT_400323 [Xylariaceae sp. FL1019]